LGYHTSYTGLLFRFLFDKNISIYSRVARANRGKVKVTKEPVIPAVKMVEVEQL